MKINISKLCSGELLLVLVMVLSIAFAYWLLQESEDEKVHRVYYRYDQLVLAGLEKESREYLRSNFVLEGDKLSSKWLPLVRTETNGYIRLNYYAQIIAAEPDNEEVYQEMANFLKLSTDSFDIESKTKFIEQILSIPGAHKDWLIKYKMIENIDRS